MDNFENYYPRLSSWFADVPNQEINKLLIRQFEAGEILVMKDHLFQNLYIVLDGVCDVINLLDNGTENITLKLTSGDVIGVSESVLGSIRNIATIRACSKLTVAELYEGIFQNWMKHYPSFANFVMKNIITRLHYTSSFAANCQTSTSKINLAKYLLDRYHVEHTSHPAVYDGTIKIQETHEMISTFLGVSPRTVERQIHALKTEGLINTSHGKICISPDQYQELIHLVTSNL